MKASDVMFEFSNPLRVQIMGMLAQERLRLSDIAKRVDVTTAEVSRHLDRLSKANVIGRVEGRYKLTQYGIILLYMYGSWDSIVENEEFFSTHDIDAIPPCLRNLILVTDTTINSGLFKNLEMSGHNISNAKKYIWGIFEEVFPQFTDLDVQKANEGIQVRKIYSQAKKIPDKYANVENTGIRVMENIPLSILFSLSNTWYFRAARLSVTLAVPTPCI